MDKETAKEEGGAVGAESGSESEDAIRSIVASLTYNMAATLRATIDTPCPRLPDSLGGSGRIYTGLGKYTVLAARGVFNGLRKRKLAESRLHDPERPGAGDDYCITPLGRVVGMYVRDHWDHLTFRDPAFDRLG